MKENKKFWFFDPEEYGGVGNMYLYFISIGAAALAIICWLIKEIFFYAE